MCGKVVLINIRPIDSYVYCDRCHNVAVYSVKLFSELTGAHYFINLCAYHAIPYQYNEEDKSERLR